MLKGHIGKCYTLLKNTFLKLCIGMVVRFLLVVKKKPFQGPINFFRKPKEIIDKNVVVEELLY